MFPQIRIPQKNDRGIMPPYSASVLQASIYCYYYHYHSNFSTSFSPKSFLMAGAKHFDYFFIGFLLFSQRSWVSEKYCIRSLGPSGRFGPFSESAKTLRNQWEIFLGAGRAGSFRPRAPTWIPTPLNDPSPRSTQLFFTGLERAGKNDLQMP